MKIETEFKDFFSDEPMTIKTTPPMNPEVEKLQNQVEDLNLKNADLYTTIEYARKDRDFATARCNAMEYASKNNDKSFNNAVKIIAELRTKEKKDQEAIGQAEHLARQCIRLTEENTNLKSDYAKMMESFKEIAEQFPQLAEDNNKYKEQVTRLVKENAELICPGSKGQGTPCGECISCKLKEKYAILEQVSLNFQTRNEEYKALEASVKGMRNSNVSLRAEAYDLIVKMQTKLDGFVHKDDEYKREIQKLTSERDSEAVRSRQEENFRKSAEDSLDECKVKITHLREMVFILKAGLDNVINLGSVWRGKEARETLVRYKNYFKSNNITWEI